MFNMRVDLAKEVRDQLGVPGKIRLDCSLAKPIAQPRTVSNHIGDNSYMLRDPSLVPLSHQHQHALSLCVRLERALQTGAADLVAWQLEVHQHYANEAQFHFSAEEKVLFPTARRFPELVALVEELNGEHERLREHFVHAGQGTMNQGELATFGQLLSGHLRNEERQLFEALQEQMQTGELKSLGDELARALEDAVQVCRLGTIEGKKTDLR